MTLFRPSPGAVPRAPLRFPDQRVGSHDSGGPLAAAPTPAEPPAALSAGLPAEVERGLARLAGIDPPARSSEAELADPSPLAAAASAHAGADFAHRLLLLGRGAAVGALGLLALAAALSARFGSGGLHVHELPFAAWGLAAALSALVASTLANDPSSQLVPGRRRRLLAGLMLVTLLVSVTGVVATSGGVAGPAWVLFLPVLVVVGAVTGPVAGLAVGGLGAAGIYSAAAVSHTLTVAGTGRLVVLLPACPAAGWAAGALAGLARRSAEQAAYRRAALEHDLRALSHLLGVVADGDLSRVPAPGEHADPVATSLAVVFADTLLALRRLVRQLGTVADQVAASATDLASGAEQHVDGVELQVAAVTQTTSTIEELAATAGSIAETATRVAHFAGATRQDVDAGASAVLAATEAMDVIGARVAELASRSARVQESVVSIRAKTNVIDEIARRTAILSVNASIEAARAGDLGAGFATVAEEVATLAARARAATRQIEAVVDDLQAEAAATAATSRDGARAVEIGTARQEQVVEALARISAQVDRTTTAAREITAATRMQRTASDAVVAAMVTVTASGDRYRAGSHGHAAAAGRLRDLSGGLRRTLERFRVS